MAQAGILERDALAADSRVVIEPSAEPMLTAAIRPLVCESIDLLIREADRQGVPYERIKVQGRISWEEGDRSIVITQHVRLPASAADAYWDSLEGPVECWLAQLTEDQVELFSRKIFIHIHWN